jgi:hypothetical protein
VESDNVAMQNADKMKNKKRELLEELSLLQNELRPIETKVLVVVEEILDLGEYPTKEELDMYGVRELFWENVL